MRCFSAGKVTLGFFDSSLLRCYFFQRSRAMVNDDQYAISLAKTEYREAYNTGDIDRLLAVFACGFTDCSDGEPSFYGEEARRALRLRSQELFRCYKVEIFVI